MSRRRVTVEYTKDVEAYARHEADGTTTIPEGTKRQVDARSAASLVKAGKAKLVGTAEEKAAAKDSLKAVNAPDGAA